MKWRIKDPFSKVPLKIKLPAGFLVLYISVMGVGGYFVLSSVYEPLDREIALRLQSETLTLSMLFDRQMEALKRRAADFASDGLIRSQVSQWSVPSPGADGVLLKYHLEENKLPIVREFMDLRLYDPERRFILSVGEADVRVDALLVKEMREGEQRISPLMKSGVYGTPPVAAIVTPLKEVRGEKLTGYLVCMVDMSRLIEQTFERYEPPAKAYGEKTLHITDQAGLTLTVPWWHIMDIAAHRRPPLRSDEIIGLRLTDQKYRSAAEEGVEHIHAEGKGVFRYSYRLPSAGWIAAIELSDEEAFHPLAVLEGRFAGIAGILAITMLSFLMIAIQYVIRPLRELQRMTERIREGDFSARNSIDAGDEIGTLARTINLMAGAIEERTAHLTQTAEHLQKRERELRAQRDLLDTIIHSMTDGVILMNFQGQVVLSNHAAVPIMDIIQRTEGHLQIRKCEHHALDSTQCRSCICDPGGTTSCVLTVGDAIYEVLSTRVSMLYGTSKVLVARNITERETMHRQQAHQERLAVLGKLAAVVAHEMNNPLAAISMYQQMMADETPEQSPFREHIDVIGRSAQTCQRIIKELLDYARMPQPHMTEMDIHTLLVDVIHFLRPFHQKSKIRIVQSFDAEYPVCRGDSTQLQQVFVNILVNAFQAIPSSDGQIEIRTRSGPGHPLIVEFEDSGVGIAPERQEEIFEPFFTTKHAGGTGLGLSTSRRIMEAHGGTLELVESRPGKTIFRVTIGWIDPLRSEQLLSIEPSYETEKRN